MVLAAVRRMRTRIALLAQPESMRSITGATQREQRHGSASNCLVSKSGVHLGLYNQPNLTPSLFSALSGSEWRQWEHSITAKRMISGLVLKYLNGECFVIWRGYETARPVSS